VTTNTIGVAGTGQSSLPARLAALHQLTRIGAARSGSDGFSAELLADADALLRRSDERMRMSASHTVVALAGGTGSGKSTLFNAMSGATFSPAGVMRPTTKHSHACVWGMDGAAPLLDWLGVQRRHRYARASALGEGEAILTGLLLLDLPDHDSVVTGSAALVDRLVKLADMLVWVLDPLKYADASVHRRYLVPLAGHSAVTTVVLNQADTLPADQIDDCAADLRRLLDSEGLLDTPIVVTSAATGAGLDELRRTLASAVAERQAVTDRIAFDIDALLDRFAVYAGDSVPGWLPPAEPAQLAATLAGRREAGPAVPEVPAAGQAPWGDVGPGDAALGSAGDATGTSTGSGAAAAIWPDVAQTGTDRTTAPGTSDASARPPWEDATPDGPASSQPAIDPLRYVPPAQAATLTAAFAKAAGVAAATETLNGARERRAISYIGWPPGRLAARLRGGNTPAPKLLAGRSTDTAQAQRADIDNAITAFAEEVGGTLPEPWSRTVRAAARSRSAEAQTALGAAVTEGLPPRDRVTGWWRLIAIAQWLLMLLAAGGLVWIALILAHGSHKSSSLVGHTSLVPWLAVMVVALLLLGWLIESWCQNMVVLAADREREQANQVIMSRVTAVTSDLVLAPAGRELAEYERFRAEMSTARARSI
jgi:GTP-binding protein EngB required for normal cell division